MKNFFTLLLLACLLSYNSAWAKDTVAPEVLQTRSQVVPMTDEEEEYEDFGIHTIDGITYHLFCEYENYRAQVQPYIVDEHYAGDIYVPDQVSYEGTTFMVVNAWDAFRDCPELTSLSIGIPAHVANNPQLKTLEIREGTTQFWDVGAGACRLTGTMPARKLPTQSSARLLPAKERIWEDARCATSSPTNPGM